MLWRGLFPFRGFFLVDSFEVILSFTAPVGSLLMTYLIKSPEGVKDSNGYSN